MLTNLGFDSLYQFRLHFTCLFHLYILLVLSIYTLYLMSFFFFFRFSKVSAELAKIKAEVCSVQTLIECDSWNPTLLYVVTYQGIMIDDGSVDLEGFVSI